MGLGVDYSRSPAFRKHKIHNTSIAPGDKFELSTFYEN